MDKIPDPIFEKALLLDGAASPDFRELKRSGTDRIYIGHEFCERLLPGKDELIRVMELARGAGVKVTLLTPFLSEKGTRKFKELITEAVKPGAPELETVFNDWGAAGMLREVPRIKKVMGRVLSSRYMLCAEFPAEFLDVLDEIKVDAVEFNSATHFRAVREQLRDRGIRIHFHWPFAYLTATRFCSSVTLSGGYFRDSIVSCSRECADVSGVARYGRLKEEILVRGNAWFTEIAEDPGALDPKPDRVVFNHAYFNSRRQDGNAYAQDHSADTRSRRL